MWHTAGEAAGIAPTPPSVLRAPTALPSTMAMLPPQMVSLLSLFLSHLMGLHQFVSPVQSILRREFAVTVNKVYLASTLGLSYSVASLTYCPRALS